MFININGQVYVGDLQHGDCEATPSEFAAFQLAAQPTTKYPKV